MSTRQGEHFIHVSQHQLMMTSPHLPALLKCPCNSERVFPTCANVVRNKLSTLFLLLQRVIPGECNDGGSDSGSTTQPTSWHLQHHSRGERQWLPRTAPYHGSRPHHSAGGEQCRPNLGVSQRNLRNCPGAGGQSSSLYSW